MRNVRSTRWGRWSLLTTVAMFAVLLIPFASPASANHGDRKLDVEPENPTKGVGTSHTLTARLCTRDVMNVSDPDNCDDNAPADQSSGAITIRFENENGPNDPDDSTSRNTPDLTCNIFPFQENPSTCSVSYVGTATGTDTWRAWIDHDGDPATDESDASETRNEEGQGAGTGGTQCGLTPAAEPDCTDVVQVTWTEGGPETLDCDDPNADTERETNPSGGPQSNETYTCTVRDENGNPTGDADPDTTGDQQYRVHAEVENGVNDPDNPDGASYATEDYGCFVGRTGQNPAQTEGQCTITITQAEGDTGTAEICFWVDGTNNTSGLDEQTGQALCSNEETGENQTGQTDTGNDLADQTEKTWEARSAAQGGLDAEPETATNDTGTNHTIVATTYDQFGQAVNETNTVNFEWFAGSPKDTDGNTPGTPDEQCLTVNASSCSETYTSQTPGRDLVCVWINATPTMTGNNQNGTCDGEGQNDADDAAGQQDAPEPKTDDVDVVSKIWVNPEPATELNCEPETATTERTDNHVINCTATNDDGGVEGTEIDVEATGANDPDSSSTPGTPDFSCRTNSEGTCQITHNGSSNNTLGDTTYRAWIDEDYTHGSNSNESDQGENVDESETGGGDTPEPDGTDVVRNTWVADPDRTITLNSRGNARREGRNMRFFGAINGDPNCEDAETVRLRRRNAGTQRFRTIATTVTNDNGRYGFRIVIRKTADYKTVTPRTTTPDACDKATSNVVNVRRK